MKFVSFAYQNASHNDISAALNGQQVADILAIELNLNAVSDPGNKNHGSATITYSLPDNAFDFLAAGETVTLTYLIEVHNNFAQNDEITRLPFTITITGTNDRPVITSSAPAIAFSGGTSVSGGPLTTQVPTSGTLAFGDVDLTDTHTVSAKLTGAVGVLDGNTVLNGVDKLRPARSVCSRRRSARRLPTTARGPVAAPSTGNSRTFRFTSPISWPKAKS